MSSKRRNLFVLVFLINLKMREKRKSKSPKFLPYSVILICYIFFFSEFLMIAIKFKILTTIWLSHKSTVLYTCFHFMYVELRCCDLDVKIIWLVVRMCCDFCCPSEFLQNTFLSVLTRFTQAPGVQKWIYRRVGKHQSCSKNPPCFLIREEIVALTQPINKPWKETNNWTDIKKINVLTAARGIWKKLQCSCRWRV